MMQEEKDKRTTHDPEEYDRIAREVFAPLFPIIAKKALEVYGRQDGICLDVGSGGGMFGYHIALLSRMTVNFLDIREDSIELCRRRGREWGLASRSVYTVGDVHHIPLPADSFPLVVSRGSIKFWGNAEELAQAFRELYRVLQSGGTTLIGNSLGPPEMEAAITEKMKLYNPGWKKTHGADGNCFTMQERSVILGTLGIPHRIEDDETGSWIVMRK